MNKNIAKILAGATLIVLMVSGCGSTTETPERQSTTSPLSESLAPSAPKQDSPPIINTAPEETASAEPKVLTYEVTGGAVQASVTLTTMVDGQISQEQATEIPLPFKKEIPIDVTKGSSADFDTYSVIAQGDGTGGPISCKIYVGDYVMAEQTSTGPYSLVTCTG